MVPNDRLLLPSRGLLVVQYFKVRRMQITPIYFQSKPALVGEAAFDVNANPYRSEDDAPGMNNDC